jgi:hypothetical protein
MSRTKTPNISVFYGDQPAYAHERRAISMLREQLARRNIPARLLVNFTVSNGTRQIDVVIATGQRCINVELKALDQALPLIGPANGIWRQQLPDGTERLLDRNYNNQALQQTYGLADAMSILAKRGLAPGPQDGRFAKNIDTVICLAPEIPPGSRFEKSRYVSVVGLDTLVDRLMQPGPGLPHWTTAHWDELTRYLGLYAEGDDAPEALRRRAGAAAVDDYRRHFRELTSAALPQLIPATGHLDGQPCIADAPMLAARLAAPLQRMLLIGGSGNGKTHTARHTALQLTDDGQLVVWIPADDYERGRFGRSLARAIGPFSTEEAEALLAKAAETGAGITVIVDGFEKCQHTEELLQQIHAVQLRYPASVMVIAPHDEGTAQLLTTTRLELADPAGEERTRLAQLYGTADRVSDGEYRTRHDITLAAQVVNELPPGASTTDVFDAYVRRRTQGEPVRTGLRYLADAMDSGVRTALPVSEALVTLHRSPLGSTPSAIDDTLASQLVSTHQGMLRFNHERLARFLAAQHLVLSSIDGKDLGRRLAQPSRHDLRTDAVMLEHDTVRRYDAIRQVGEEQLFADAVTGKFGPRTAKDAIADITELLIAAAAAAPEAQFDPVTATWMGGRWHGQRRWTPTERAMLRAAGACAHDGRFLHEIGALLDATDETAAAAMADLRSADHTNPISEVIAATYSVQNPTTDTALAASYVTGAADLARFRSRPPATAPIATPMWRTEKPRWGRLYMAALLSQPIRHPDDAAHMPDLFRTGWDAGGYHLRLDLLYAAQTACRALAPDDRQRMIDLLTDLEPKHIFLSSTLIEVLASYGQIEPMRTLEDIKSEIADVLADDEDPANWEAAQAIIGRQFDDERILGPYSEAIDTLHDTQRLKLCAMAVCGPQPNIGYDWAMKRLAEGIEHADDFARQVIADAVRTVREDNMIWHEVVAGHLHALRGWARICETLPEAATAPEDPREALLMVAWRCIDELLLNLFRGTDTDRSDAVWTQLRSDALAVPATVAFADVARARMMDHGADGIIAAHDQLISAYRDELRQLLEWALAHRNRFDPKVWNWRVHDAEDYIVHTLGLVGVASTAELLRHYIHDPDLGVAAVDAIRQIEARGTGAQ